MKIEELEQDIELAKKSVAGFEEPFKSLGFREVLRFLLNTHTTLFARSQLSGNEHVPKIRSKVVRRKDRTLTPVMSVLKKLIQDDFFNDDKSSRDIVKKFYEIGHKIKDSSITVQLQELTRTGVLSRSKNQLGKRQVWFYKKNV